MCRHCNMIRPAGGDVWSGGGGGFRKTIQTLRMGESNHYFRAQSLKLFQMFEMFRTEIRAAVVKVV